MKNDTTFVRMRSSDHVGDAKCRKLHLASLNLTFLRIAIDENGFLRIKEEGQMYKSCLKISIFWGLSYDLSKV